MDRKKIRFIILILTFFIVSLNLNSISINQEINHINEIDRINGIYNNLNTAASAVNGRPLIVNQYANITKSYSNIRSGDNVSFTLYNDWVSQNTTVNYEGVAQKKNIVINSGFDSDDSDWDFKTNIPSKLDKLSWDSSRGYPTSDGCTGLDGSNSAKSKGDYGYFEQNITLPNEELRDDIATFSFNYNSDWALGLNASLYMSVIIGDVEINKSVNINNLPTDTWFTLIMNYNPVTAGQILPGEITVRVGFIMNEDFGPEWVHIYLDNFRYELWTEPNEISIIHVLDNQFAQNHTYYNTTFGQGYSFIDTERIPDFDHQIDFTVFSNISNLLDFNIDTITISSHALKRYNTTVSNNLGSLYTLGENVSWQVEFSLTTHADYNIWLLIEKPNDWEFIHVVDGFEDEIVDFCLGKGLGSSFMEIPSNKINSGLWKLEAISENYISNGNMYVWESNKFIDTTNLTYGDLFYIGISLNESLSLPSTQINISIFYPNASIFWHTSREPVSYNEFFGNFTVGNNMTVGKYAVEVSWVNNQSYLRRDRVGFLQLELNIWHHTNLTAVNSYFEQIAGDPLLLKVNFFDYDFNTSIHFATITYSSTFGASGTMIYLGSGIYFIDINTNSLPIGNYYFSFNTSKIFYENLTVVDLIQLKIIAQPLALEVSHDAIDADSNSIVSCQVNVTGAISGTYIYPANISTDWFNSYNITDHNNGSYTIDLSTQDIPLNGIIDSYVVSIYANKTNYGTTTDYITLIVHPIPTIAYANSSLISVNSNEVVNIKVNYTDQETSTLINGANCTVEWDSSYSITPQIDGFSIELNTIGLSVNYYSALIQLSKPGYTNAFRSVTIIINEQDVNLIVSVNSEEIVENTLIEATYQQEINISVRVFAVIDSIYLSGGKITWLSNNFDKNLTESSSTYYTSSIVLDGAYFSNGINNIFLRFDQNNYSSKIFPFQLFIKAQTSNISLQINSEEVLENHFLSTKYNEVIYLSGRALAEIEKVYLTGGSMIFVNGELEFNFAETTDYWYNISIPILVSTFSIGSNNVYISFELNNYTTSTFSLQIYVNQIEFEVNSVNFENFIEGSPGDSVDITLNLTESGSSTYINNATIFYSWDFDVGYFTFISNGIYEVQLDIPVGIQGDFNFKITISKEGSLYKSMQHTFVIDINPIEGPDFIFWTILIGLLVIIGVLGSLSLRSYVIIPRKRRKEADLISKTQHFKDLWNIQAVIIIQKESGLPVYAEEISSMMDGEDNTFLISGFIQAISAFSETFIERELEGSKEIASDAVYSKSIIDLDFKYFQLLVCDHEDVRILLILKGEASERLKRQLYLLSVSLNTQFGKEIKNFSGDVRKIQDQLLFTLNQFLFLHYNGKFEVTSDKKYFNALMTSGNLTKMERRIVNVILSMTKTYNNFRLKELFEQIHEKNEDLLLEALGSLIQQKVIISTYSAQLNQKKLGN